MCFFLIWCDCYWQWWKYKFGGPGTVKMPGAQTDFRGPTLISVTYYRKWIRVWCRVMFSALGPGMDLNQAFQWNFRHFGARNAFFRFLGTPERRSSVFRLTFATDYWEATLLLVNLHVEDLIWLKSLVIVSGVLMNITKHAQEVETATWCCRWRCGVYFYLRFCSLFI